MQQANSALAGTTGQLSTEMAAALPKLLEAGRAAAKLNPAYGDAITFINVDWDQHSNSELARTLKIPRRSTLVVLKGDQELGRIVAGTSKSKIKDLLDTALTAATA